MRKHIFGLALAALAGAGPAAAADDLYVYVGRHGLDCVVSHAADYAIAPTDPVLIVLSQCPPGGSGTARSVVARNAYPLFPATPPNNTGHHGAVPVDSAITLTKDQLKCLSSDVTLLRTMVDPTDPARYRIPVDFKCPKP